MPRAIWSGSISFGLVNIPVKLYSAVSRKNVRFHQLDGSDKTRIQQKRVNPKSGEEVPYENLVKGYEISPETYVVIEPAELDAVAPEKTRAIDIEDFVELEQIDPIYFDHPYYLAPEKGAEKAYSLLLRAMRESGRVAVARVVIRSKEQLVAIRPVGELLAMETMLFSDEVVPTDHFDDLPDSEAKTTKREVDMARQLIDSLAGDFEPDKYRDEYRDRVMDLIERKAQGEEVVTEMPDEEAPAVPDLMAALEASISSSKRQSGGGSERKKEESGTEKKAPAKKSGSASSSNGSGSKRGSGSGKGKGKSKAKASSKKS
jgi:DNA end-binding protein Ku